MKRFLIIALYPAVRAGLFIQRVYWQLTQSKVVGAKVLIHWQGRVLLVRNRYGSGLWTLPGGTVRAKEAPIDGLKREVAEELGVALRNIWFLGESESMSQRYGAPYALSLFAARVDSDIVRINDFEISAAQWFSLDTIPVNVSPIVIQALRAVSI